ncbi:MAG: hypothetical protein JKY37_33205 [Nannocystaceae bacterium]|nr:hypothetical protein [Nannocystaceae bacterium]
MNGFGSSLCWSMNQPIAPSSSRRGEERRVVVHDEVNFEVSRDLAVDRVEELPELDGSVPLLIGDRRNPR